MLIFFSEMRKGMVIFAHSNLILGIVLDFNDVSVKRTRL